MELLPREEGEGLTAVVVIEAVLLIRMTELAVTVGVIKRLASLISLSGIANEAEVAGRDHNHGLNIGNNLLVFLKGVNLGANDDPSTSFVVVQHMDILEGEDTKHRGSHFSCTLERKQKEECERE